MLREFRFLVLLVLFSSILPHSFSQTQPVDAEGHQDGQHNDAIAKVMAALYLTLRVTPIVYYGEEIGMANNDPARKEDVKDPPTFGVLRSLRTRAW